MERIGDKMEVISKICINCKNGTIMNCYYETMEGKLNPCFSHIMYCEKLDDYVENNDFCDAWESCIKTIKVTYK